MVGVATLVDRPHLNAAVESSRNYVQRSAGKPERDRWRNRVDHVDAIELHSTFRVGMGGVRECGRPIALAVGKMRRSDQAVRTDVDRCCYGGVKKAR